MTASAGNPSGDTSARLIFPFHDGEDELTVHFDPESGLINHMTAQRYRTLETNAESAVARRFHRELAGNRRYDLPAKFAVTWEDLRHWCCSR
ncbi:MAG: DUF6544 family protein [Caldilineaceae bacterium]